MAPWRQVSLLRGLKLRLTYPMRPDSILIFYNKNHGHASVVCFLASPGTTHLFLRTVVGGVEGVGIILLGGGGALTGPGGLAMHRP